MHVRDLKMMSLNPGDIIYYSTKEGVIKREQMILDPKSAEYKQLANISSDRDPALPIAAELAFVNYTGEDNTVTINIEDKDNIKVEITDTGKGINEEDLPYIWDRYYKNKKKHKRNLVGTGLGLSIVKNILGAHKYEYGVKTKKDHGTTFYFIINK